MSNCGVSIKQNEMEAFTTLIVKKMKDANMFAGQGGPIILAQVLYYNSEFWGQYDPILPFESLTVLSNANTNACLDLYI